jgi:formylglycine-generating enzyme required for sulfatase activity/predicted Ser/Thr protein kinase
MQPFGQPLAIGTVLEGRYRIAALLGEGGMSRVYLADAVRLGVRVALKENLQTDPQSRTQFEREAQILARLSHPNLPRVTDHFADVTTGRQYLVMDYVEGEDLEAMVKRVGLLPEATALAWVQQILYALEYLHSQMPAVIHRDIKPANIKITPQGKAVLVDFGIAKMHDPTRGTLTGARAVTPGYAPPEQYGLRTDARSDIYALGATLYTMLTGRVPPEAPLRASGDVLIPPRQLVPALSSRTEGAILRAVELQPTRRWQTASEFRAGLTAPVVQPPPPISATVPAQPPSAPTVSPWAWAVGGAGAMLIVGLVFAGIVAWLLQPTPTPAPTPVPPTAVARGTPAPPTVAPPPTVVTPSKGGVTPPLPLPTATPRAPTPVSPTVPLTPGTITSQRRGTNDAEMVFVPAGEFLMGSSDADKDAGSDEKPQHTVYLDAFWIDKYEVTNAQYKQCVGAGRCQQPSTTSSSTRSSYYGDSKYDNYPVIGVSWRDAILFCEWAGKRLPTEAEWEKAARGAAGRIYPWGDRYDISKVNADGKVGDTTAVGSYPAGASPYGAMDMAGNVWEWVADWYDAKYYASSPKDNPTGPSGSARVLRGGAWDSYQYFVRAADRNSIYPDYRLINVGFRCAQ